MSNPTDVLQRAASDFAEERDWNQFHTPKNLAMALAGEVGELVEIFQWLTAEESAAVMSSPRAHDVRDEAIGQLLDYRRHITPPPKALAVLLPSRPTDDLVDLITSLGMHCVSETVEGTFVQHTAS